METRETERHYEVTSRVMDSQGSWLDFKIKAVLSFTADNKTKLSVSPMRGDKFWFEKSDPALVHTIASMIANVAKDCMEKSEVASAS